MRLMAELKMSHGIHDQTAAFLDGLYALIPPALLRFVTALPTLWWTVPQPQGTMMLPLSSRPVPALSRLGPGSTASRGPPERAGCSPRRSLSCCSVARPRLTWTNGRQTPS